MAGGWGAIAPGWIDEDDPATAAQAAAEAAALRQRQAVRGRPVHAVTGRPVLQNPDGTIATEESVTLTHPVINSGAATNVPSVWNGRRAPFSMAPEQFENWVADKAVASGQQFPAFGNVEQAVGAAKTRTASIGFEGDTKYTGRREGATTKVLDSLGTSVYDALARPSRIWGALNSMQPGEALSDRPDIVDAGVATSLDLIGLPAIAGQIPKHAAGIFGGKLAKTADHAALARAEEMASKGANRDAIWKETGWFKGPDDKWRFEIPDHQAKLNPNTYGQGLPQFGKPEPAAGQLWHSDLYEAYPEARQTLMRVERGPESGRYFPTDGKGASPVVHVAGPDAGTGRSVALHEMQHDIQAKEGFARGADPEALQRALPTETGNTIIEQLRAALARGDYGAPGQPSFTEAARNLLALESQVRTDRAADLYRRSAGEVESRNVQTRREMTPEQRRATPPWVTEDVPLDMQISQFGSLLPGGGQ